MRKLYKQDIIEILYGATLLGAGGGVSLCFGLDMLKKLEETGEIIELDLLELNEIGDDEYAAMVAGLGSPVAMLDSKLPMFGPDAVHAFRAFQKAFLAEGKHVKYLYSGEMGGFNTFVPMLVAILSDKDPVKRIKFLDVDSNGRAVPELNFDIISEDMKKYLEEPLHQNGYADPTVVVHQRLREGKPSIESAYDEVLNTRHVYRTIEQNLTEGFGASFINCFGDPGVIAARCKADFLVFGGFEPAILFALGLADRVGIITVLDNVQPMLWEHVHNAKIENRVVSIRNVNMPVLGLEDHSQLIEHLTNQAFEAIKSDGVEAFVLGCTGMLSVAQAVESNLARAGYTVPVIEPGQAAMAMCEMIGKLGYTHSRLAFPKEMKA